MNMSQIILQETARHFMRPMDGWSGKSRARDNVTIKGVACAVAVRAGCADEMAAALSHRSKTVANYAAKLEAKKKYLMHIVDVQARIARRDQAEAA